MKDQLKKLLFQHAPVRGEFVELSETWRQIQSHHGYPLPVTRLLGEMIGAAVLLSANIKFDGSLIMQVQGSGPVRLLVVECDSSLKIRATAKLAENAVIKENATFTDLINPNGTGRFVITLDPHDKVPGQRPYQGIVSLDGESISRIIENYMKQSEQLDTRIWLAADSLVIRGLLLQKMPPETGPDGLAEKNDEDDKAWEHLLALASTLKTEELLETDIETLQHRLFWEEDLFAFDPVHPAFSCSCSREKVGNMLKMLGKKEIDDALKEQGNLAIHCDFCGKTYSFDPVDCAQLFTDNSSSEPPGPSVH